MQNTAQSQFVPAWSARRGKKLRKCATYLALIATVLQDAPDNMLTFSQLMDNLEAFVCEDRKAFENNIRVCLSTSKCFVKIPMSAEVSVCKRNFWKLDHSQITAKMVRRHFKGMLDQFPELVSKEGLETMSRASERCTTLPEAEDAACGAVEMRCEVKFSGPFSIESLLKRDAPSAAACRASPLSSVPLREQQPRSTERGAAAKRSFSWDCPPAEPLLQAPGGSYPICTTGGNTDRGLTAAGAARPLQKKRVCTEPSFLIYTRPSVAPYFSSPQSSYIKYPVHTFTHEAHRFRL